LDEPNGAVRLPPSLSSQPLSTGSTSNGAVRDGRLRVIAPLTEASFDKLRTKRWCPENLSTEERASGEGREDWIASIDGTRGVVNGGVRESPLVPARQFSRGYAPNGAVSQGLRVVIFPLTPAKAGAQEISSLKNALRTTEGREDWIPACAGMCGGGERTVCTPLSRCAKAGHQASVVDDAIQRFHRKPRQPLAERGSNRIFKEPASSPFDNNAARRLPAERHR
jgi:hypothetical protein